MNVTKTEFAALAKVSPGRVSQWISEGKIGPDQMEGRGQRAKIKLEDACSKLNLRLDEERLAVLSAAESRSLALGSAMADVITAVTIWRASGDRERQNVVAATDRFQEALAAVAGATGDHEGRKRGAKRHHHHDWARAQLIALALTIDGLPAKKSDTMKWLGGRYAEEFIDSPSESTLNRIISEFYGWSTVLDRSALKHYSESQVLQETFGTAEDYLQWNRLRNRLAQRYLHDEDLQSRFETPADYISAAFENFVERPRAHQEQQQGPKGEL